MCTMSYYYMILLCIISALDSVGQGLLELSAAAAAAAAAAYHYTLLKSAEIFLYEPWRPKGYFNLKSS